jgi:hypothetical protein
MYHLNQDGSVDSFSWVSVYSLETFWYDEETNELCNIDYLGGGGNNGSITNARGGGGGEGGQGTQVPELVTDGAFIGSLISQKVKGAAELTQAEALAKIKKADMIILSEKTTFKTFAKVAKVAKFAGNFFGFVSMFDHIIKAKNSFSKDGINSSEAWINVVKVGADGVLMIWKANPVIATVSVGYSIFDSSGWLE